MKSANDRFYRAADEREQNDLNSLRWSRDRMFRFLAAREVVAEAPSMARLLEVRETGAQCMPFIDFIIQTSGSDLVAAGDNKLGAPT